ncbi:MAG: hypothetical protein WC455_21785 [Dehalococcoidia bacterium]
MMDHLIRISYDVDTDPNLPDAQRAQVMLDQLRKVAGTNPIKVGDTGEQILRSPMTATVQAALKEALNSQSLKEMTTTFLSKNVQDNITGLKNLAQVLETEPAKILEGIANDPASMLKVLLAKADAKPDDKFLQTMASEIRNGNLTPERLTDQFGSFTGKTSDGKTNPVLPWDFRDFRTQVMNLVTDSAKNWSVKQYGVKEAELVNRFAHVLKATQSAFLLDVNPAYAINNAVNNWVTRAAQGVFGFMTKNQIDNWYERFGGKPVRIGEGFTPSGDFDTVQGTYGQAMSDVRDMVNGKGALAGMLKEVNKARQKFGFASKISGQIEKSESAQAYTIGTSRMWDRIWRPGNGFRKMSGELEAQLQAINPDLPGIIYAGISHSMNPAEIEAALFKTAVGVNVANIIDEVADRLYPDRPDVAREMLKMTGIEAQLTNELANAQTPDQIDTAIHRVRDSIQDVVDRAFERKVANAAEETKARIATEGFSVVVNIMSEMEREVWSHWLEHYRDMAAFNEWVDTIDPAQKNAQWRRMNARESKGWDNMYRHKVAVYGILLEELGINTPETKKMLSLMESRLQSLRDFFDGFDVDAQGNRVTPEFKLNNPDLVTHVDGKNDLYRKAFEEGLSFSEVEEMMNEQYGILAEANRATQAEADKLFTQAWPKPEDQQMASAFRKRIADIQFQMDTTITTFRKTLQGKSRADRSQMWHEFLDKTYLPLIDRLQTEEVKGMRGMGEVVKPEVGEVPPEVTPADVPDVSQPTTAGEMFEHAKKVDEALKARDADQMRYENRLNRDIFMDKVQKSFKYSDDEMKVVTMMLDLYTTQWSKRTGREAGSWYGDKIADIDRGGKASLNQLFQSETIYDVANRYSIATATKDGRPNDKHLLAIVNKYGEKIKSAADITPENLTAALEARRIAKGEPEPVGISQGYKGAAEFLQDGRAIIHAFEGADISTIVHEMGHIFRRDLPDADQATILNWTGEKEWSVQAEEQFARGFERWLSGDISIATPEIHRIFQLLKSWLVRIYRGITGSSIDVSITPEVRGVFERMLFDEDMLERAQPKPIEVQQPVPEWIKQGTDVEPLPKGRRQQQSYYATHFKKADKRINPIIIEQARVMLREFESGHNGERIVGKNPTTGERINSSNPSTNAPWYRELWGESAQSNYGKPNRRDVARDLKAIIVNPEEANGRYVDYLLGIIDNRLSGYDEITGTPDVEGMDAYAQWLMGRKDDVAEYFHQTLSDKGDDEMLARFNNDPTILKQVVDYWTDWLDKGQALGQQIEWTPDKLNEFVVGMITQNNKQNLRLAISDEPLATRIWLVDQMHNYSPEAAALVDPVAKAMYVNGELTDNVFSSKTRRILMQSKEPLTPEGTGQKLPPVFDDADLLDEVLKDRLNPILDEIQDAAQKSLNNKNLGVNGIPPEQEAAVRKYIKQVTAMDMPGAKMTASRYGEMQRDMSMLNYQKQYGFDTGLNLIFPYQFWYTRTMMNWAKRAIDKPAWFSFYARMREMQRKNEQKGIPERMRGKIRIPAPFLPDWMGGAVWYDPNKQLFPFSQFGNPLDQINQSNTRQEYVTQDILRDMVRNGRLTTEEMNDAINTKQGINWEMAWAQAGDQNDNDLSNPANLVGMMMQPAMYLTAPYNVLKGTPEKIGTLPMTRLASGIETISKDTPLEGIGKFIGTLGAGGERYLRDKSGLSEFGEYGDYYVNRQLASMVADGEIDSQSAIIAMSEKSGEAWDQAYQRVAQEQALRVPGLMPLAAIKGMKPENAGASIATGLATAMFPAGIISKGEIELRGLSEEYSEAWKKKDAGDTEAVSKFFDEHPEYEARLAQYKEPQERLRNFLTGQIWDAYNDMTGPNKKVVREALGDPFIDTFLDKTVSDTTAIDLDTLAYWARFMGAKVPKTEETKGALNQPLYQQKPVEMFGSQTNNAVQAYWDEKNKLFPNIDAINDLYYNNGRSKAVLIKFPELREFWDWNKKYKAAHPEVAKYTEYQKQQSGSFGASRAGTETATALTIQDFQQFDPALQRQLLGYIYGGESLTRGARQELYRIWQKAGRPGGTLDEYVESIKRSIKAY